MVSTFAAAVLAALGLTGSTPAGHAAQSSPAFFAAGHGWGHGVGLAQYGAYGYALHGWTYDQIVAHYYPGTTFGEAPLKRVRVLLVAGSKRVVVSSPSPFTVRDASGKSHKLAAGRQELGPALKLKLAAAREAKALPGPLVFVPGADPLSLGGRAYRGSLRVSAAASLRVVNIVALEPYLWGVVPSEMPDRWPAEALQAQAVVARTYALSHLHKGGDFDLYPDTRSQVYGGIAAEAETASDAVTQTAGEVVLYKDELADTFFFSSSGGRTANVQDVWPSSGPIPYLVSVPDPYDTLSPYHDWGPLRFTPAALGRRLGARGRLIDVKADTAASGRVRMLTLIGTNGERTISGSAARAALGMRSTWFTIGMLNLTPPAAPVVFGSQARLAGLARGVGKVTLESRPYGGQWKPLAPLTSRSGQVAATLTPKVSTDYRLSTGEIRSGVVRLSVAPFVRIAASTDHLSLSGLVRPLLPNAAVQLQRLSGSVWTTVARTTVQSDGTFTGDVELTPGTYRARVVAGKGFAIGLSKVLTVVAA
ncbi:MAG: SpoIID/LytB domain-containing protein [Actinomycetota bacterium]|nr:SpoIID/LytB domain-containing protein [Actinomycetota bacterium]